MLTSTQVKQRVLAINVYFEQNLQHRIVLLRVCQLDNILLRCKLTIIPYALVTMLGRPQYI